jgi:PAS domain S-box-containing protein
MTGSISPFDGELRPSDDVPSEAAARSATAVLDNGMRVIGWSREAERLFGHRAAEVLGRSVHAIFADAETGDGVLTTGDGRAEAPRIRWVRHRDGRPVCVALAVSPLSHRMAGAAWLVVATDAELVRR